MDAKQKLRMGLQWGALAWLVYIAVQAIRDELNWALLVWPVGILLLVAGSRWARHAVALGIAVQLVYGFREAFRVFPLDFCPELGPYWIVIVWLCRSGIAQCLGMVPLVLWRAEGLRVTAAMCMLGRFRDAWTRSGGLVAMLAAIPMVIVNHATLRFFHEEELGTFVIGGIMLVLARYGEVIFMLPLKGKHPL
jgi:hypothetical protein